MEKAKLWVRWLTLAPSSTDPGDEDCADDQDSQREEECRILDQECLARTTEIAITVGQGNPW
jgi:hypothetical protein